MTVMLPTLYRKRFIPLETVSLKDDIILNFQKDLIITRWNTLKPRTDIAFGISAYFIKDGFKVSKIFDHQNHLVHWYCDIIQTIHNWSENSIYFEDLLIDVIIYPDGRFKVVDMDELADAYRNGLIDMEMLCTALYSADHLLSMIADGSFEQLKQIIEQYNITQT